MSYGKKGVGKSSQGMFSMLRLGVLFYENGWVSWVDVLLQLLCIGCFLLIIDYHGTPEELQTQLLPYMAKTRIRPHKPGIHSHK